MSSNWCLVCGTRHAGRGRCPGELLATGTERHGRRWTVVVAARTETYGVLVAPSGEEWRARILTYPGMLWSVPGGRTTMKFVGATAAAAEDLAAAFVQEHCQKRGYKIVATDATPESGGFDRERGEGLDPARVAEERHPHALPVRFGETKASQEGRTADLSHRGMFVVTREPVAVGRGIRLLVALDGFSIPVAGRVVWVRPRPDKGRPAGMGIELSNPPAMYSRYVARLEEKAQAELLE